MIHNIGVIKCDGCLCVEHHPKKTIEEIERILLGLGWSIKKGRTNRHLCFECR